MTPASLPDHLELDLPECGPVELAPPVVSLEVYCEWLQMKHEERVRSGQLEKLLADPLRDSPREPFRLD